METSVQELICHELERFFRVQSVKFSSSGREDVDVRTLGLGRPFAVELLDPHKSMATKEELAELQRLVNSSTNDIQIRYLQLVEKEQLNTLKQGEEEKTKIYSALCVTLDHLCLTDEEIDRLNGVTELVIKQKTPLRVLHRLVSTHSTSVNFLFCINSFVF
jgi:tRNA pseudouridine synthase 10